MQQLDDSNESTSRENKLEKIDTKLLRLLAFRTSNHLFKVKGLLEGEKIWSLVLVDSRKKHQLLEKSKTGSVDQFHNYGIVLATGSDDMPEEIRDQKVSELLSDNFLTAMLHKEDYDKTYYVLCDPGRKREIMEAPSAEEIKRHGKILYVANDEDPPEVISTIILKTFYSSGSEIDLSVMHTHVEALRNGDMPKLKVCLPDDVNSTDHKGWTILHHAAFLGSKDVYTEEFFLRSFPDKKFNARLRDTICGRMPIHIAAREGHLHILEFLLSNGMRVNETDDNGWIPLHYAAWKGDIEAVKFLIRNFACIYARDHCLGKKPLHVAAEEGHTHVVELLLQCSLVDQYDEFDPGNECEPVDDHDDSGRTPLYYAAAEGCLETARLLIDKNANLQSGESVHGLKPIHIATFKDNRDMIELLLDRGSDIESKAHRGQTPLHFAASHGQLVNVKLLVDRKANPAAVDADGKTPLDYAKDHPDVVSYIEDVLQTNLETLKLHLVDDVSQSEGYGCVIL